MLGNCSDYGGNRLLQYIQTKTWSPVFSSLMPLVGFYNIAPSQPQPCSGVTPSPSVPVLPLLSALPHCFLHTITTFTARHRFVPRFKLSTQHHNLPCQFPLATGVLLHPLASSLWSLGCSPPPQPTFSRVHLIFPAPKKLSTRPQFWALTTHLWILGMPMMC